MEQLTNFNGTNVVNGPFGVAVNRGSTSGTVSSQWFSRPDDQRFTNLNDLHAFTLKSANDSRAEIVDSKEIRVVAERGAPEKLELLLPNGEIASPTHWSFGQACRLVGAPSKYLRSLPGELAAINLQYGLVDHRAELVKTYSTGDGTAELRAITGPEYGRIHDHELVSAFQRIAGDGTGRDGHFWKIPGVINWRDQTYDPMAPITRESTTLFASDRDVFLFLVDDTRPIEIGKLPDGSPDLVFRGVIAYNSEVGSSSLVVQTFLLRGVCQNRCIWGMEGFQSISVRHSKFAPDRFAADILPALEGLHHTSDRALVMGIQDSKAAIVAKDDDDRTKFLKNRGFSKPEISEICKSVVREEGREAASVWDMVQGITAYARTKGHQNERVALERKAGNLMAKFA
jgi:hypothetical protein